ncbi:hypothetical protein GUF49_04655, partial [Xanthomonas citri pv. citri]|nr:hypothetical protein [Xanthomonas citri pv. citri]
ATKGTVAMSCRWKYGLMGGDASGLIDLISISAGISVPLASGSTPLLTEFRVTEVSDIQTDITGLTILFNWLAEDIANIII